MQKFFKSDSSNQAVHGDGSEPVVENKVCRAFRTKYFNKPSDTHEEVDEDVLEIHNQL